MSRRILLWSTWVFAGIVLVFGIVLSVRTVQMARGVNTRLENKLAGLEKLRGMRNRLVPYELALGKFNAMAGDGSFSPGEPFSRLPTGLVPQDIRETRKELAEGWTVVRKTCSFTKADIRTVMMFINGVESRRPPWRLARCDIRALTPGGGIGYVEIHLEALQREARTAGAP
ncbi:MAG: hypothetical protein QGI24_08315 [Kiritimatiellia bacterium]|jgi:hypothetical protein|nr:hypothetical protein [Kiritimatiellia bacterium]MDP6848777.1 hypothetical protein [Kiritimatiellia bacterium]